ALALGVSFCTWSDAGLSRRARFTRLARLPRRRRRFVAARRARRTFADGFGWIEAVRDRNSHFLAQKLFDFGEIFFLFGGHQRHRFADRACTTGAADAMDVILRYVRKLVVDDER